jgi:hypothetical protein
MDARRAYEWKVSFGLWTALGILAGLLIRGEFKPPTVQAVFYAALLACIVLVYIFVWSIGLHRRNAKNRRDAQHFWNLAVKEFETGSIEKFKVTPIGSVFRDWSHLTQILITLMLAIVAVVALFQGKGSPLASAPSPACEGSCIKFCKIPDLPEKKQPDSRPKPK